MSIRICGPRDRAPKGATVVNTTSRAKGWSRGLSPFLIGPVELYNGHTSRNVENAWQFSKVYQEHLGENNWPNDKWWEWAQQGWATKRAVRYPMGKGANPVYSYWNGRRLKYWAARKRIYCPLYARAVRKTSAFGQLKKLAKTSDELWLWCFDGYDHIARGRTLEQVMKDESKNMGHSFVLAMLLTNDLVWKEN